MLTSAKIQFIEKTFNYSFANKELLLQALTHRSKNNTLNNERLEFIGDAILDFIVGEMLFLSFSSVDEGVLTRMRSHLVCGESLAEHARALNIDTVLMLGSCENNTGGHQRSSTLADAFEALVAAVYFDSNSIEKVKQVFSPIFTPLISADLVKKAAKDAKTLLQEYLQANNIELPEYAIQQTTGKEHAQTFYVSCNILKLSLNAIGKGSSRRKAEQDAAAKALELIEKNA